MLCTTATNTSSTIRTQTGAAERGKLPRIDATRRAPRRVPCEQSLTCQMRDTLPTRASFAPRKDKYINTVTCHVTSDDAEMTCGMARVTLGKSLADSLTPITSIVVAKLSPRLLPRVVTQQPRPGRGSNSRPLHRKSDATAPPRHPVGAAQVRYWSLTSLST